MRLSFIITLIKSFNMHYCPFLLKDIPWVPLSESDSLKVLLVFLSSEVFYNQLFPKYISGILIPSVSQIVWIRFVASASEPNYLQRLLAVTTKKLPVNTYKPSVFFVGHMQTVQNQIRCHRMQRLIRLSTVCLQNFPLKME